MLSRESDLNADFNIRLHLNVSLLPLCVCFDDVIELRLCLKPTHRFGFNFEEDSLTAVHIPRDLFSLGKLINHQNTLGNLNQMKLS